MDARGGEGHEAQEGRFSDQRGLRAADYFWSGQALRMSRYDPVRDRLRSSGTPSLTCSLEEIADLIGGLPDSALRYAWWYPKTTTHSQCKAWQAAGYDAEVDMA